MGNQVSFEHSFVPAEQVQGTSDRISEMKTATYHQNRESSQIKEQTTLPQQMTMNTKTPQHHAVTNNSSKNIIANKSTGSAIEPIFPPNYFLSAGMLPWEPSPAPFATSLGNETNTARGLQQTESCDKNNAKNKIQGQNSTGGTPQSVNNCTPGSTDIEIDLPLSNEPTNYASSS